MKEQAWVSGRMKGIWAEERTWEPAENLVNAKEAIAAFHSRHPNRSAPMDLKDLKPRRSSAHRTGGTVMNDREPREDRRAIRTSGPTRSDPVEPARIGARLDFRSDLIEPGPTRWQDRGPSSVDKIFTQRIDFL